MKQLALCLLLMSTWICAFGQKAGDDYAFTSDVRVYKWDDSHQTILMDTMANFYRAKRGYIFTIEEKVSFKSVDGKSTISGYRVKFWQFNDKGQQVQPNENRVTERVADQQPNYTVVIIGKDQNSDMFFVKDQTVKDLATNTFNKPAGLFTVDGIVLPIKLRFKNNLGGTFDFSQSISVGPAVQYQFSYGGPFSQNSFSILFGANATSIPVDQTTVPTVVTSKTTEVGISPFLGFNWQIKGVSFGLITGIDVLTGKAEDNWVYRKSPWLGFTIGTSFIQTTKKSQNTTPSQ